MPWGCFNLAFLLLLQLCLLAYRLGGREQRSGHAGAAGRGHGEQSESSAGAVKRPAPGEPRRLRVSRCLQPVPSKLGSASSSLPRPPRVHCLPVGRNSALNPEPPDASCPWPFQLLDAPVFGILLHALQPFHPPNSARLCYTVNDACTESSLDIQMITQYGQGSGASFGFAASSANASAFKNITNPQLFGAYLGLRPLPDVLSLSWGGLNMNPADGVQPVQGEALLAKMVSMCVGGPQE